MHLGLSSRSFLFQTPDQPRCLFVFHSGHGGDPAAIGEIDLMQRAIDIGCDVIALRMPLINGNPQATVNTRFGPVRMTDHGALALLDMPGFSPIRYFMQPIASSINFAQASRGPYRAIAMTGYSGGGWATTLYAAIDPRNQLPLPDACFASLADRPAQCSKMTGIPHRVIAIYHPLKRKSLHDPDPYRMLSRLPSSFVSSSL